MKPLVDETELRNKVIEILLGDDNLKIDTLRLDELMALITSDKQRLLKGLMEEFIDAFTWEDKSRRHDSGLILDNDDQVIGYKEAMNHVNSVIQNKLEGLS